MRFDKVIEWCVRVSVTRPITILIIGLTVVVALASGLPSLVKDPDTDSLIPPQHPSVAVRDRAEAIFGLRDPMIIALAANDSQGIFTPDRLAGLAQFHERVEETEGVRAGRVKSIASESRVHGDDGVLYVDRFYDAPPRSQSEAEAIRLAVLASPPHREILVSQDASTALIIVELYDSANADAVYSAALDLADQFQLPGVDIHVAGQGAVTGHLSASIDKDTRTLPGIATALIFAIVFLAFLRFKALLPLLVVIAASVGGSIGLMAWLGIKYFAITSALPIILIAISVADVVHILSKYFALRARFPDKAVNDVILDVMLDLWRPLTLTTLTTMGGFFGIAVASVMPPLSYFGWFAFFGVFLAWAYSLFVVPSVLAIMKMRASPAVNAEQDRGVAGLLTRIGRASATRPGVVLGILAIFGLVAANAALHVRIDRAAIENFRQSEPIRVADAAINDAMAGVAYLDVLVETAEPNGLLSAERLEKISALQTFMETLPHVSKSVAVTDVVSELHRATNSDVQDAIGRPLPLDDDAVAQLFLLYEVSGDPEDLSDELDVTYQHALVRGYMNSRYFSQQRPTVERLERYLAETFNEPGMTGLLSGRVNIDYHWMLQLAKSHGLSIVVSLIFVAIVAMVLFRSVSFGMLSVAPVGFAIAAVYGVMGAAGIFIEPGTSMFAAISIGVGVDFAIHFLDRLRKGMRENGLSVAESVERYYPVSARACFLNAATLALGFSVLMASELPTLFRFGVLIAVAAIVSFVVGLVAMPAALALGVRFRRVRARQAALGGLVIACGVATWGGEPSQAQSCDNLTGPQIAQNVNERPEGDHVSRALTMVKTTARGSMQEREAHSYRAIDETGEERGLIVYTAPRSIRGTAFMTHDMPETDADRRWLFLPSRGRPMRIPDAERGKYFLGTGFTYEDIKTELKLSVDDYVFENATPPAGETHHPHWCWIAGRPIDEATARELGYGATLAAVDPVTWIPMHIAIDDRQGRPLKTIVTQDVAKIDGVWTALTISVDHKQKQHETVFSYRDVSYRNTAPFDEFVPENMDEAIEWDF